MVHTPVYYNIIGFSFSSPGIGHEMKSDEFWDYEKQVDLEAFSCNEFYSILSKQSRDVTSSIARQKDQVNYMIGVCVTNGVFSCHEHRTQKHVSDHFLWNN